MQVNESEQKLATENIEVVANVQKEVQEATGRPTVRGLSLSGYERNLLGRNDGNGRFENISSLVGVDTVLDSRSVVSGDIDIHVEQNILGARGPCLNLMARDSSDWMEGAFTFVEVPAEATCSTVSTWPDPWRGADPTQR